MKNSFLMIFLISSSIFMFSSCQKGKADEIKILPLPVQTSVPKIKSNPVSSVREIDFKNFTYPWTEDHGGEFFTLIEGKKEVNLAGTESGATFDKVEFGDVTNDGIEEALIGILPETGGNCQCEMVFIYTIENEQPKLLWSFDTWDKAQGGFKRAFADNGNLIIETFGDNKFENGKWKFDMPEGKSSGLCCPTAYTKIRFKWNGEVFAVEGKPELFKYDRQSKY